MEDTTNSGRLKELLTALADQLARGAQSHELVVVGGAGLLALEIVDRGTKDVDVVARIEAGTLLKGRPLPAGLVEARDAVAEDFGVSEGWLNAGPADLVDFGLPDGILERLDTHVFNRALTVHFVSRYDQIHFKLYAFVDQGLGKHEQDLRALDPSREELLEAARWARTHDPSPGFREVLERALAYLGVEDVDLGP
ncbi:MAG: hypothetical protein M0T77_09910 [Actinomycetota bacterium]|nr:hypothetical protein [Actinomycetota bacterium]